MSVLKATIGSVQLEYYEDDEIYLQDTSGGTVIKTTIDVVEKHFEEALLKIIENDSE